MRRDIALVTALVLIVGGVALGLSFVDDISKQVLAPLGTVLAGAIAAFTTIRLDAKRRAHEMELEAARRKDARERAEREANRADEAKERAIRDAARPVAVQLAEQFGAVASSLRTGSWPDERNLETGLTAERLDRLASVVEDWSSIRDGLSTLVDIAEKVGESDSQRIRGDLDLLRADFWADKLEWAADELERASWSEDRLKLEREKDARIVGDLTQRISELVEAQQAER